MRLRMMNGGGPAVSKSGTAQSLNFLPANTYGRAILLSQPIPQRRRRDIIEPSPPGSPASPLLACWGG